MNDPPAMFQLALVYQRGAAGAAVAPDERLAGEWMRKAMDAYLQRAAWDNIDAMRALGWIYADARPNLSKDMARAAEWYGKAAQAGDAESMYQLGQICAAGQGVQGDAATAAALFKHAAELGHTDAMRALADAYHTGTGVERDENLATEWAAKARQAGAP